MNAILYSRNGHQSMQMVYGKLRDAGVDVNLLRRVGGSWRLGPPREPINRLIRWGSIARSGGAYKTYNPARGIRLASNKAQARMSLQDSGIPVPRTAILDQLPISEFRWEFPVVLRPFRHNGGRNFHLLQNLGELRQFYSEQLGQDDWYVSEFYPKQNEYRVQVGSGMVLIVNEKVPREGQEDKTSDFNQENQRIPPHHPVLSHDDPPLDICVH